MSLTGSSFVLILSLSTFLASATPERSAQIAANGRISQAPHKKATMRAERMQPDTQIASLIQEGDLDPETLMSKYAGGFSKYKAMFARTYEDGSDEHLLREQVFRNRMSEMVLHNKQGLDWSLGVNQFTDRTEQELKQYLGYRRSPTQSAAVVEQASLLDEGTVSNGTSTTSTQCGKNTCAAGETCTADTTCKKCKTNGLAQTTKDAVDWSMKIKGSTSHVMDQGSCGSCWAVAATGAIEMQLSQLDPAHSGVRVSPEAMMQCSPNTKHCGGDGGCKGSTPELGFDWVVKNPLTSLSEAPYTAKDLSSTTKTKWCKSHSHLGMSSSFGEGALPGDAHRISIAGYVKLPLNKEEPVVQALVCSGPVVAAAWASTWFSYDKGILSCPKKGSVTVDHAILMVGFGVDNGKHYWKIRNSWGANFGENGFLRLKRSPGKEKNRKDMNMQEGVGCKDDPKVGLVGGECGILSDTAYPVGTKVSTQSAVY